MIGLKRHTVRVVKHDPAWASLFLTERRAILDAASNLIIDMQHVGSTAVPKLPAKPILDIAIAVATRNAIPQLAKHLSAIGYIDRGDAENDGGYLLVKESRPNVRTIHVHAVEIADVQWRNYIAFRDTLRQNPVTRRKYAELKQKLYKNYQNDRKSYTASKNDFITAVLRAQG